MRTTEIPCADWAQALVEFGAIHDGWLVSLDILSPDIGAQPGLTDPTAWSIVCVMVLESTRWKTWKPPRTTAGVTPR